MDPRLSPLLNNAKAKKVFDALEGYETRFVGGCVRDALMGRNIADIDLATTAFPEQVIARLKARNIPVIPTGIDHGTVTAIIDKTPFEITTLRKDVATDGRHATIEFSNNWKEDALRRDFTINAISLDPQGQLYDYFDGKQDIEKRHLRFIGNASQRIQEDYLRILRFFRFSSVLDWFIHEDENLQACIALASQIKTLSRERVQSELYKLLTGPGCIRVVKLMVKEKILQLFIPHTDLQRFENLVTIEYQPDGFRRMIALAGWQENPEFIVLSKENKKTLENLRKLENTTWPIEKTLYFFGKNTGWDHYYLQNQQLDTAIIANWEQPVLPLKAEDIFHLTNGPGILVGQKLKQAELYWVDHNFTPNRQELLDLVERNVG